MKYHTIVIGAGAAGLVIAIGLAKAGKKVLLIEKGHYGGDCSNFGCIPSKSLIASSEITSHINQSELFGVKLKEKSFDANEALLRVQKIVADVVSHEDPKALNKLGVETLTATASFLSKTSLTCMDKEGHESIVHAKKIVIATGSKPHVPNLEGLQNIDYLTNESVFSLKTLPKSLTVLGGGPIGLELAQAFAHLGVKVSLIVKSEHPLSRETLDARNLIEKSLLQSKIDLHLNAKAIKVANENGNINLVIQQEKEVVVSSEKLLVATGRVPNISTLNLEAAEVSYSQDGIVVDNYGRTTQKNIYAAGDCIGAPFFTHYAENQARTVLKNLLLFPLFKKSKQQIPRVTFTDPEVASIGLTPEKAIEQYGEKKCAIYHIDFKDVDRALTTGEELGFIKVVTKKWSSQILGATIVGKRAGEMLSSISLGMYFDIPFRKFAKVIFPYPTYNQGIRKASDLYLTQTIIQTLKSLFTRHGKK